MAAKKMTGGKTPPKPKSKSQTASTRIPGGALASRNKIGYYKTLTDGRERLIGSIDRNKTVGGQQAKTFEKATGRKVEKIVITGPNPFPVENYVFEKPKKKAAKKPASSTKKK